MKTRTKVGLLLVAVFLLVASYRVSQLFAFRRDFREAELMAEVIWPVAREMKRFANERGRPPNSLDEIAAFAPDHDVAALRRYQYEFSTTGTQRFFLRVNSRYAFAIDEHYTPNWWFPTSLSAPSATPK